MLARQPLELAQTCCAVSRTICPDRLRTSETCPATAWPLRHLRHPCVNIRPLFNWRRLGAPVFARMILRPRRQIEVESLECVRRRSSGKKNYQMAAAQCYAPVFLMACSFVECKSAANMWMSPTRLVGPLSPPRHLRPPLLLDSHPRHLTTKAKPASETNISVAQTVVRWRSERRFSVLLYAHGEVPVFIAPQNHKRLRNHELSSRTNPGAGEFDATMHCGPGDCSRLENLNGGAPSQPRERNASHRRAVASLRQFI